MATKTASYEISCAFSEKQVEADVASYFGFISAIASSGTTFRLLDTNEQLTGADKLLNWNACAYYFQFKIPTGLRPMTKSEEARVPRKNASAKQAIRRFRLTEGLDHSPHSLCFELRGMAKNATELQHNILYRYENIPTSRSMYVCPLSLDDTSYTNAMRASYDNEPFLFWRYQRLYEVGMKEILFALESTPFLRGHISVTPHDAVNSADHYYSFSPTGTDIAFHSPLVVAEGPSRLSDYIASDIRRLILNRDSLPSLADVARSAYDASRGWAGDALGEPTEPFEWLQRHGVELRRRFQIRQMLLLIPSPKTDAIRSTPPVSSSG